MLIVLKKIKRAWNKIAFSEDKEYFIERLQSSLQDGQPIGSILQNIREYGKSKPMKQLANLAFEHETHKLGESWQDTGYISNEECALISAGEKLNTKSLIQSLEIIKNHNDKTTNLYYIFVGNNINLLLSAIIMIAMAIYFAAEFSDMFLRVSVTSTGTEKLPYLLLLGQYFIDNYIYALTIISLILLIHSYAKNNIYNRDIRSTLHKLQVFAIADTQFAIKVLELLALLTKLGEDENTIFKTAASIYGANSEYNEYMISEVVEQFEVGEKTISHSLYQFVIDADTYSDMQMFNIDDADSDKRPLKYQQITDILKQRLKRQIITIKGLVTTLLLGINGVLMILLFLLSLGK